MAVSYTYDDFLKAYNQSGIGFSNADMQLAQKNPNAGMGLIDAKVRWNQAKTAAERAKYNQQAESIRSLYGGYLGGDDGFGYTPVDSPNDYTAPEKPTFSYNLESDPVWQAYKKQYTREGQRATQDALGTTAASTGGIPSSYATAAATQAGDYYAAQMTDKVPELYQQAYNRYLNELSQWNADRSFGYGQYIDELNTQIANRQEALQNALYGAQYGDYSGLADLGYDISNIPAEWDKLYNTALIAGQYGDWETLKNALGITANTDWLNNTEAQQLEIMLNLALNAANPDGLNDPSYLRALLAKYFPNVKGITSAAGGSGSSGGSSGSSGGGSSNGSSITNTNTGSSRYVPLLSRPIISIR